MHSTLERPGDMEDQSNFNRPGGDRIAYMHIPKTGGTSVRNFLKNNLSLCCEGSSNVLQNIGKLDSFSLVSAHLNYPKLREILDDSWELLTTFRSPLKQVVSHLCWVRLAVEPGHEARLSSDPKVFVRIAKKMLDYDFSDPQLLGQFVDWLEESSLYFFHDNQTRFLIEEKFRNRLDLSDLKTALSNLQKIEFVGDTSRLDDFMSSLTYFNAWNNSVELSQDNPNPNRFGIDVNNEKTVEQLRRMISFDEVIYSQAQKRHDLFVERYKFMSQYEKKLAASSAV